MEVPQKGSAVLAWSEAELGRPGRSQWLLQAGTRRAPSSDMVQFSPMHQSKPWCLGRLVISVSVLEDVTFQLEEQVLRSSCTYFPPSQFSLLQPCWWHLFLFSIFSLVAYSVLHGRVFPSSSRNPGEALPWDGTALLQAPLPADQSSPAPQRSQNHRMVGVGRDLCGSPSPTPC